jgi:DNA-binding FadR family transcriptional regulator
MDRRLYSSTALHGQVAHHIGRQIVSGEIAPGAYLPREAELSEQFSVSRQAVREGLKVLAAKGLVKSRRRAGTSVTPRVTWNLLDPDVLAWHANAELMPEFKRDLFELRWLVEPEAAALSATRADVAGVARIGAALEAMRETKGDPVAFQASVIEFHLAVFAASGNSLIERLSVILGPLMARSFRMLPPTFPMEDYESGIATLSPVYDAIRAGDPVAARAAMGQHLSSAMAYFDSHAAPVAHAAEEPAKSLAPSS